MLALVTMTVTLLFSSTHQIPAFAQEKGDAGKAKATTGTAHVILEQKIETDAKPETKKDTEAELQAKFKGLAIGVSREAKIGEQTVPYTLNTGVIPVTVNKDKKGEIFFTSYIKAGEKDPLRPITFCYNGGPGSSSVWLHLGGLSPKRVAVMTDRTQKPFDLQDNPDSILDLTDLVFIDPVSTGFSRGADQDQANAFHNIEKDLESIAEFIRLYTTRNDRWSSPKYLCGESYGGLRTAALSQLLLDEHQMELSGLIMVSPAIDFQTIIAAGTNDLPYILFMPSFTATAFYHKKLDPALQKDLKATLKEAEAFAQGHYARALLMGDSCPPKFMKKVIQDYARLTGLSEDYVRRGNLRIRMQQFSKELMRDQNLIIGRYDGKFTAIVRDQNRETYDFDPSSSGVMGQFSAAIKHYYHQDLGLESDLPYKVLSNDVSPWKYEGFEGHFVDVSSRLRSTMLKNPEMRVLNLCGYTDLATPYMATHHTMNHLLLPEKQHHNITYAHYMAGHMMYVDPAEMKKMKQDLAAFYLKQPLAK